jgi:hypothetical protein
MRVGLSASARGQRWRPLLAVVVGPMWIVVVDVACATLARVAVASSNYRNTQVGDVACKAVGSEGF